MTFAEKTIYKQKHATQITLCIETLLKCGKIGVLYGTFKNKNFNVQN